MSLLNLTRKRNRTNSKSRRTGSAVLTIPQSLSDQAQIDSYHSLFVHHPDTIITMDLEGIITSCNKHSESLIGLLPEEIEGPFHQFVVEDYLAQVVYHFTLAAQGKAQNYYCQAIHRDGHIVDLSVTSIPMYTDGKITGVYGIIKDITERKDKNRELTNMKNSLNRAQEVANIGSWEYDIKSGKVFCSEQTHRIMGVPLEAELTNGFLDMVHPKDLDRLNKTFSEACTSATGIVTEFYIIRQDSTERFINLKADFILDDSGQAARLIGTFHDITEHKLAEQRLMENQKQLRTISDAFDVGIRSLDFRTNTLVYASSGMEPLFGVHPTELLGMSLKWTDYIHPDDVENFNKHFEGLASGVPAQLQYRIYDKFGNIKWVDDRLFPSLDSSGDLIRVDGLMTDIHEQKLHEEKINFYAYHDYLTGLPNRHMYEEELRDLIRLGKNFALLFLDMDRFKFVNDTLGHSIGDELLKALSKRLATHITKDDLLVRLGGDEFAILLSNYGEESEAIRIAGDIIEDIEKTFMIEDYELHITTSIGIGFFPQDGQTVKELTANADLALYRAKDAGKNNLQLYTPSLNIETYKSFLFENDLRKAITEEQFLLHFQPKVDPITSKIIGAEALIRWIHPEWGILSPGEFIPIAEGSNLILEIGDWVLRSVCKQINEWQANGVNLVPISINVSPKRFNKGDLALKVSSILAEMNIDPKWIEFEITETSLIQYEEKVLAAIATLKEMGIAISLDDFGTGYSSIGYLKKFKADYLKIDRSFISGITPNAEDKAIVKSILSLAHGLNMKVVAEGVETAEEAAFLVENKCDFIQGFLFSKPLQADDFAGMLAKGTTLFPAALKAESRPAENRREYFRIQLPEPLDSLMTIVKINGKTIRLGKTKVEIDDIGLGGLRFNSSLKIPESKDFLLRFEFEVLENPFTFEGNVAWKQTLNDDLQQYGVEFNITEKERENLAATLNKLAIKVRK
ncbi:EAL domain-containing protein [Mesobacillus harenae]|uniref:EAL domain-containing protein n=1 Tax=Mesobacillus harenae TaxID=2213203 RepID=UPI001580C435|nr:EAL domain-containing protein [Mesobacillus harenae]